MKKKYLRPVPKTANESDSKKAPAANARRKLSLTQIIVILAAFLIVSVAVVVPVCVVYVDIPVKPTFVSFDQQNSYSISVTWKKTAGATSYDLEYCHEDPSTAEKTTRVNTQNNRYTMQRYAGPLFVRVRANKNKRKGKYSDWIRLDVESWTLAKPLVTINESSLQASWTPVNFRYYNDYSHTAPAYVYTYGWKFEDTDVQWNGYEIPSKATYVDLSPLFGRSVFEDYLDYYAGLSLEWPGDLTLYVKVAALNESRYDIKLDVSYVEAQKELQALNQIYETKGEFGEAELLVTKEIFDALPKEVFNALVKK